jgi:hypothetical protein
MRKGDLALPTIRVVVFESRGRWIAQCLDYDLCTSAAERERLPRQILSQLRAQIALDRKHGREPFQGLSSAPPKYWEMYRQATRNEVLRLEDESLLSRILRVLRPRVDRFSTEISLGLT